MSEKKSQIEQFLADYKKAGGQDPLVWRIALPYLGASPQRKRGPKARTMGKELHDWYLVQRAARVLRTSGDSVTKMAAYQRAGVSETAYRRANKNSLVKSLEQMKVALIEAHKATGRSPLSAESFWWDQVEAIHADWETMRAQQLLKQGHTPD